MLKEIIDDLTPPDVPPEMTAVIEKFTVSPGGTLIGDSNWNIVVAVGAATVTDWLACPKTAVRVRELSTFGLLTVTVTLLNSSEVSGRVLV